MAMSIIFLVESSSEDPALSILWLMCGRPPSISIHGT